MMPAITPSHLYTFFAMMAVSSLLIFSFMAYANALRASSERTQLKSLMNSVAAKCTELLTFTLTANASAEAFIQMPARIGEKRCWLQLCNDSTKAWLAGGLGDTPLEKADLQVALPKEVNASGYFIGGCGSAHLKCYLNNCVPQLELSCSSDGD
jgi:hypothetical protein